MAQVVHIASRSFTEVERFDFSIDDQRFQTYQLREGSFSGRRDHIQLPGLALNYVEFDKQALVAGALPEDRLCLIFPLNDSAYQYNDCRFDARAPFCLAIGGGALVTPAAGGAYFALSLKRSFLLELLSEREAEQLFRVCDDLSRYSFNDEDISAIHSYIKAFIERFQAGVSESAALVEQSELLQILMQFLGSGEPKQQGRSGRREVILYRAMRLAIDQAERGLSVAELAAQVNVSVRTLQYIFGEFIDLTPKAFLRNLRMNCIRRQLVVASYAPGRVQSMANACGIVHMGNFTKSYRKLFGESPRQTLIREREALLSEELS